MTEIVRGIEVVFLLQCIFSPRTLVVLVDDTLLVHLGDLSIVVSESKARRWHRLKYVKQL